MEGLKRVCWCCKEEKDLSLFHKNKNNPLGRSYLCAFCSNAKQGFAKALKMVEEGRRFAAPGHKICKTCKVELPYSSFSEMPLSDCRDGYLGRCKPCVAARGARYYMENKDRHAELGKAWRDRNRDHVNVKSREWIAANPDKMKAYRKKWVNENRDHVNAVRRGWRRNNPEKARAADRAWYQAHKEKLIEASRAWRRENKQKSLDISNKWKAENPDLVRLTGFFWRQANRGKVLASKARRRAVKLQRTPKWLTPADFERMALIYDLAKGMEFATGIPHHVDHIIPLRGKLVSGLHCPSNLQIITAAENCSKSNKWNPDQ